MPACATARRCSLRSTLIGKKPYGQLLDEDRSNPRKRRMILAYLFQTGERTPSCVVSKGRPNQPILVAYLRWLLHYN